MSPPSYLSLADTVVCSSLGHDFIQRLDRGFQLGLLQRRPDLRVAALILRIHIEPDKGGHDGLIIETGRGWGREEGGGKGEGARGIGTKY